MPILANAVRNGSYVVAKTETNPHPIGAQFVRTLARKLKYVLWTLNGYVGRTVSAHAPQKVTVLITYYHPARMQHIEPQVRNILKCTFVDKLVISNHNPMYALRTRSRSKIAAWSL